MSFHKKTDCILKTIFIFALLGSVYEKTASALFGSQIFKSISAILALSVFFFVLFSKVAFIE